MTYEEAFHKIEESGLEIMITEKTRNDGVLVALSEYVVIMHEVTDDMACEIVDYNHNLLHWPWINDMSDPLNNDITSINRTSVLRFHVMLKCVKIMC